MKLGRTSGSTLASHQNDLGSIPDVVCGKVSSTTWVFSGYSGFPTQTTSSRHHMSQRARIIEVEITCFFVVLK